MTNDGRPLTFPMNPASRIQSLDLLRGVALLGMLVVHFHDRSTEPGGFDEVVRTLIWRLVESKSHGTFALLFGAGFAIQLRRAEERGAPFAGLYLRRLAVLAFFGFAAHAFFGFNVLLGYAVWGTTLLVIRTWSTRTLLVTALLSAASLSFYHLVWSVLLGEGSGAAYQTQRAAAAAVNDTLRAAGTQADYTVLVAARLRHMAWFYTQPFFFMPNATLALFIAGFLLVRHRIFEQPLARRWLLAGLGAFGVISWLAENWLLPYWRAGALGILRDQWLMLAYIGGALWLLARTPGLVHRLGAVAAAGRMALTNYLMQIVALDLLFSGYGLGLGHVRPVVGLAAALLCFGTQAALSTVWLRHFRFGPAEWLWRSLTYGRRQPMRRAITQSTSASVSV
jgi:uncharacterized protein